MHREMDRRRCLRRSHKAAPLNRQIPAAYRAAKSSCKRFFDSQARDEERALFEGYQNLQKAYRACCASSNCS